MAQRKPRGKTRIACSEGRWRVQPWNVELACWLDKRCGRVYLRDKSAGSWGSGKEVGRCFPQSELRGVRVVQRASQWRMKDGTAE